MKTKKLLPIFTILLFALSIYFSVAGPAQSVGFGKIPITLYHFDQNGKPTIGVGNVFTSGESLGMILPDGVSAPYWISVTNELGSTVWGRLGSVLPSSNLFSIGLAPRSFPPNHEYSLALEVTRQTLPGILVFQNYQSAFIVSPGYGQLSEQTFLRSNGSIRAQVRLVDPSGAPSVGVRVGLFLSQGGGSLQIAAESTNGQGIATFQFGESLTGGQYSLEARVLDNSAFFAPPVQVSSFSVDSRPTSTLAWRSTSDQVTAAIRQTDSNGPVPERLLVLEQRLSDGNLATLASSYSSEQGVATFATSSQGPLEVSFKGDGIYAPSTSTVYYTSLSPAVFAPSIQSPAISTSLTTAPLVGSIGTSTTLLLPSTAYSTIPIVLTAVVKDSSNNPVPAVNVTFSKDSTNIGIATTNSTGAATTVWNPNTVGSHAIKASFAGNPTYQGSSAQQSLTLNQTPTTTMILKPLPIAYSWDLYLNNTASGRPIVVPVVTLTLAPSGNGSPANIYMPAFSGSSTTPQVVPGYGWAGLNQSSAVTITFNSTYTQTQTMSWTSNFYLPPCPSKSLCIPFPDTGHMFLNATLAPPSNLYSGSFTTLNVPVAFIDGVPNSTNTLTQDATPPSNLYVNVNATIPYLSVKLQGIPVALATYVDTLAYTLGAPPSSSVKCTHSGCVNSYTLPILGPSRGADFAFACMSSGCNSPAANVQLNLYNSKGMLCVSTTTDSFGVAPLNATGSKGCTYPYSSISTPSTSVTVSELFAKETSSKPGQFITNFQGYYYTLYAPQRATRYLLNIHAGTQVSVYTVLYPGSSIPDIRPAITGCCDVFLTVAKRPVQMRAGINPGNPTVLESVNATVRMFDQITKKTLTSASFNYTLTRIAPGPTVIARASATTDSTGLFKLALGLLSYGNYTFSVSRSANATESQTSNLLNFTVVLARPTLIISPGWLENALPLQTYLFTTSLVNNATGTLVATSGLVEQVYVNDALFSQTWLCSISGCAFANYYLTNPGGNVTFPWVAPASGQYKIEVRFPTQSFYSATSITIMASVAHLQVSLSVSSSPPEPDIFQNVTWNVQARAMIDNATVPGLPVTQFINGVNVTTANTNSSGNAQFIHKFTSKGIYNVTFTTPTNGVYTTATSYQPILVFIETSVTLKAGTINIGQQSTLNVTLSDSNGNPIPGRTVRISIGGTFFQNVTTDSNGQAQFSWKPTAFGRYSISASFAATAPGDIGYKPSTSTIIIKLVPQATNNTSTTPGGTQGITFTIGNGTVASGQLPSISISFPSLTTLVISVSLGGVSVTATVNVHFLFGVLCVAKVNTFFGTICVMSVPFEETFLDATVSTVIDFHLIGQLFGTLSTAYTILNNAPVNVDVMGDGVQASALIAGIGLASTLIPALGPHLAGELVLDSYIAAVGIGDLAYGFKTVDYRSYLYGMIVPAILGVPCGIKFVGCATSLLPLIEQVPDGTNLDVLDTPLVTLGWGFYFRFGVLPTFTAGDYWPAGEVAGGFLIAAVALALQL